MPAKEAGCEVAWAVARPVVSTIRSLWDLELGRSACGSPPAAPALLGPGNRWATLPQHRTALYRRVGRSRSRDHPYATATRAPKPS